MRGWNIEHCTYCIVRHPNTELQFQPQSRFILNAVTLLFKSAKEIVGSPGRKGASSLQKWADNFSKLFHVCITLRFQSDRVCISIIASCHLKNKYLFLEVHVCGLGLKLYPNQGIVKKFFCKVHRFLCYHMGTLRANAWTSENYFRLEFKKGSRLTRNTI